jgi:hypothetical protein
MAILDHESGQKQSQQPASKAFIACCLHTLTSSATPSKAVAAARRICMPQPSGFDVLVMV